MKNDERISVGLKYHNRLNHKEIVQIYGLDSKQMWGQNGKEDVIIVLYEVLSGTLGEFYTLLSSRSSLPFYYIQLFP